MENVTTDVFSLLLDKSCTYQHWLQFEKELNQELLSASNSSVYSGMSMMEQALEGLNNHNLVKKPSPLTAIPINQQLPKRLAMLHHYLKVFLHSY